MSALSVLEAVAQALAPKGSAGLPAAGAVEATVFGKGVTFGQMQAAVALVENFSPVLSKLKALMAGYGPDVKADAVITLEVIEIVSGEAASIGIPYASDVELGAMGLAFVLQILPALPSGPAEPNKGPPIAAADWSNGPPAFPTPWGDTLPEPSNPSGEIGG